ncbi:hypothetical protein V6N12_009421 [Hibiscus sabdariffa]|uniref:Uncharacterized protein n=1 Tax=Hibiscus sabdariffa TaxID=183260 RepID=A0ABR2E9I3_9ROSI
MPPRIDVGADVVGWARNANGRFTIRMAYVYRMGIAPATAGDPCLIIAVPSNGKPSKLKELHNNYLIHRSRC